MRVEPEMVWTAYRALLRYVETRPLAPLVKLPKQKLPYAPPRPLLQDCTTLAADLTRLDATYPLPVDPEYYAYLYEIIQFLRCFYLAGPTYTPEGLVTMRWMPLIPLLVRHM